MRSLKDSEIQIDKQDNFWESTSHAVGQLKLLVSSLIMSNLPVFLRLAIQVNIWRKRSRWHLDRDCGNEEKFIFLSSHIGRINIHFNCDQCRAQWDIFHLPVSGGGVGSYGRRQSMIYIACWDLTAVNKSITWRIFPNNIQRHFQPLRASGRESLLSQGSTISFHDVQAPEAKSIKTNPPQEEHNLSIVLVSHQH